MRLYPQLTGRHLLRVRKRGLKVGVGCRFIAPKTISFGSEPYLITIGNHVTVSAGVRFVTHDGGVWILRAEHPDLDVVAPILIEDNVFIGADSIILPGVRIGSNVVIGAGSIVTKSVPSESVAVGVPARVVGPISRYREKSLIQGIPTHGLPPKQKREELERRLSAYWSDRGAIAPDEQ